MIQFTTSRTKTFKEPCLRIKKTTRKKILTKTKLKPPVAPHKKGSDGWELERALPPSPCSLPLSTRNLYNPHPVCEQVLEFPVVSFDTSGAQTLLGWFKWCLNKPGLNGVEAASIFLRLSHVPVTRILTEGRRYAFSSELHTGSEGCDWWPTSLFGQN